MKIINMLRVQIPQTIPLFQEDIIKIERNHTKKEEKRGYGGVIPTLTMFMVFMNRNTLN